MRRAYLCLLLLATAGLTFVLLAKLHRPAEAAPLFVWPWAGTEGWRYTQGFHVDHALDFQPQITPGCDDPVDTTHTIRPTAPGHVTEIRYRGASEPPLPVSLVIDHGGGWSSYYTHLANIPDAVATIGAVMDYTTDLGNPSCYTDCTNGVGPPCATGRHVHFQLRKDGSGAGIMQTAICGWTVGADSGISRDGNTYYPDLSGAAPIANTGCAALAVTATPSATERATPTPANTATPTATATPTPTSTATPTPTPTATRTPSPTPTAVPLPGDANCDGETNVVDALLVLQYAGGLVHALRCPRNANVNADGVANAIDAAVILQYVAGLIPSLPV